MILNGNSIEKAILKKQLIENASLENIHSSSYDLTIGDHILKFKNNNKVVSLSDIYEIDNMYDKVNIKEGYNFKPGECILFPLEELFNIPSNICASIRGRTSYNRLGLFTTIQHLNPGFKGRLNISIVNNSTNTYIILPKMKIAQVIFEEMDNIVSENLLYYNESNPAYQNEDGLQGSKVYNDFIGKVVRHFKGNYYYIENVALNSETKECVIIYKTLYDRQDSKTWIRPAKMFFESIDPNRSGNVTKQTHRFEIVDNLTIDYTKIANGDVD